jgi:hypothetical protein
MYPLDGTVLSTQLSQTTTAYYNMIHVQTHYQVSWYLPDWGLSKNTQIKVLFFFQSLILYLITFQHAPKDVLDGNNYNNVQLKLIILWILLLFLLPVQDSQHYPPFHNFNLNPTFHGIHTPWPGSHKPVSTIFGTTHLIFILKLLLPFKVPSFSLWCTMAVKGRHRHIVIVYRYK